MNRQIFNYILKSIYVTDKEIEDKTIEQTKDVYNFDQRKDIFDKDQIPSQLEFFFGGDNDNFVNACNFLSRNKDNNEFVSFLCSDTGQNIMRNNSLLIHIESIIYIFKGNFYNFLIAQQDETKPFIPERISYHYSFEKYAYNYPAWFSLEEIDQLSHKNSKYLFHKFNDWIETLGAEKILIRHTSNLKDGVGLQKMEKKDKQFLIEVLIYEIEKKNPYAI